MERAVYDHMAQHDSTHWWYRARRDVLASVLQRDVGLPQRARILEIGCGTGHNLPMLQRFGEVDAIELDAAARAIATDRLGRPVGTAALPALADVPDRSYDLVALLDVLEHVADDVAALTRVRALLRPGGAVLLTVPQHQWLWSGHDVANHHFRRYSRRGLRAVIAAAGLTPRVLTNFNSLLFPLAVVQRIAARLLGRNESEDVPPPAPLNALFERVFALERHLVGRVPLPPGVSLLAVLEPSAR